MARAAVVGRLPGGWSSPARHAADCHDAVGRRSMSTPDGAHGWRRLRRGLRAHRRRCVCHNDLAPAQHDRSATGGRWSFIDWDTAAAVLRPLWAIAHAGVARVGPPSPTSGSTAPTCRGARGHRRDRLRQRHGHRRGRRVLHRWLHRGRRVPRHGLAAAVLQPGTRRGVRPVGIVCARGPCDCGRARPGLVRRRLPHRGLRLHERDSCGPSRDAGTHSTDALLAISGRIYVGGRSRGLRACRSRPRRSRRAHRAGRREVAPSTEHRGLRARSLRDASWSARTSLRRRWQRTQPPPRASTAPPMPMSAAARDTRRRPSRTWRRSFASAPAQPCSTWPRAPAS